MRTRIPFACASVAFVGVVSMPVQAEPRLPSFDFEKINAAIADGLEEFSSTSNGISLRYTLDEAGTDVDADKYLFDVQLGLAQSPWGGPLKASGSFEVSSPQVADGMGGFDFAVDAVYETDALSMLKYRVTKVSKCDTPDKGAGIMGILWIRHCEYVARLDQVKTVAQLHDLLEEKLAAHKADLGAFAEELKQAQISQTVRQQSDLPSVSDLLRAELARVDRVSAFLNGVKLEKTNGGFSVEAPAFSGCPFLGSNGMKLEVTPDSVAVKGNVQLKFGGMIYRAAKPVIVEILHDLELHDQAAIKLVKLDAEVFVQLIRDATEGESPHVD